MKKRDPYTIYRNILITWALSLLFIIGSFLIFIHIGRTERVRTCSATHDSVHALIESLRQETGASADLADRVHISYHEFAPNCKY